METHRIALKIVPEPDPKFPRSMLIMEPPGTMPFMRGQGDTSYVCGNCDTVLAENINRGQIVAIILKCQVCGCCNQT